MHDPDLRSPAPRLATTIFALSILAATGSASAAEDYELSGRGTRILDSGTGLTIKVLVEASVLGGNEVEIAEITFPGGSQGGRHVHGTNEIFYVLSGVMEHVVDGEARRIEPGGIAIVRQGDAVEHRVLSEEPVKALVIWAPGGEVARLEQVFESRPID